MSKNGLIVVPCLYGRIGINKRVKVTLLKMLSFEIHFGVMHPVYYDYA